MYVKLGELEKIQEMQIKNLLIFGNQWLCLLSIFSEKFEL